MMGHPAPNKVALFLIPLALSAKNLQVWTWNSDKISSWVSWKDSIISRLKLSKRPGHKRWNPTINSMLCPFHNNLSFCSSNICSLITKGKMLGILRALTIIMAWIILYRAWTTILSRIRTKPMIHHFCKDSKLVNQSQRSVLRQTWVLWGPHEAQIKIFSTFRRSNIKRKVELWKV